MIDGRTMVALRMDGGPFGQVEVWRRQDDRNVRIANGRRSRPVGRYASIKNGQAKAWESRPELLDIYHAEVDAEVVSYSTQPETLRWTSAGLRRQYTPDRVDNMSDGSRRFVEVKDKYVQERDPQYAEKLNEAAAIYEHFGHTLTIRDRGMILSEPLFSAVERVQAYRRALVTPAHVMVVGQVLGEGAMTLGDFIERLPPGSSGANVMAMMVRRIVSIDLNRGLTGDSKVTKIGEPKCVA